jgi:hypothetical protein
VTQEQLSHRDKLLLPENSARLKGALESLPRGDLSKWFIAYFRKQPLKIWRLLEKPPKVVQGVRDEDIVQSLERIRAHDVEVLGELAKYWLGRFEPTISALEQGKQPDEFMPMEAMRVARWLVNEPAANDTADLQYIAELETRVRELEAQLVTESRRSKGLEHSLAGAEKRLLVEARLKEERLERQKAHLEREFEVKLKRELDVLIRHHLEERRLLDSARHKVSSELEFFKAQLDDATDKLEESETRLSALRRDLFARDRELVESDNARTQLRSRIANFEENLNADVLPALPIHKLIGFLKWIKSKLESGNALSKAERDRLNSLTLDDSVGMTSDSHETLLTAITNVLTNIEAELGLEANEKVKQSKAEQHQHPFQHALLQQALVIDYQRLSHDPIQRLKILFQAYRAFLEGRNDHEALQRASNIAALSGEPQGVLVLGLERMLEDGANTALEGLLDLRVMRQESVLRQLVGKLESPRLARNA